MVPDTSTDRNAASVRAAAPDAARRTAVRGSELLRYRDDFPLLANATYLNTCSLGALSSRSRAALDRHLDAWDRLGARAWYGEWLAELDALRDDFGWAIGRPGREIALAPNVSVALASVASALDPLHRSGRNRVVTTALDFPTLGHQWLARAPLGVEVVVVPSPDGLTVPLDALAAAIDERTALVATGHVYFTTGAAQDIAGLAALARERGARVLIDAYQATGLIPTDVLASGVDFYVSGTLKWLFGGSGTAFLWVRPDVADELAPTTTGWFSSARQFAFDVAALEFASGGRKFEMGTPSLPSAFIARGGMAIVREIGIEALHARTVDLGTLAIRAGEAAGLEMRAERDEGRRGGIVAVVVSDPKPVVDALAARGMIVDFRPGIIRLSPAFYNTEDEVLAVIDAIADLTTASPPTRPSASGRASPGA
jgi:kynureninase